MIFPYIIGHPLRAIRDSQATPGIMQLFSGTLQILHPSISLKSNFYLLRFFSTHPGFGHNDQDCTSLPKI